MSASRTTSCASTCWARPRYFLPHLLALSTSSPFWQGEDTGLKSYRIVGVRRAAAHRPAAAVRQLRRISSASSSVLVNAGLIEDATKIWWDLRPSARFPTLEMRITDVCPLLADGIAIAALFRCILRMLYRLRRREPALALLPALSGAREPLARPALRHRRKAWSISARARSCPFRS